MKIFSFNNFAKIKFANAISPIRSLNINNYNLKLSNNLLVKHKNQSFTQVSRKNIKENYINSFVGHCRINSNFYNNNNNNNSNKSLFEIQKKNFSIVEKIKLSEKIKLVDISEVINESTEFAFDQLQFYLSKENFKKFIEDFQSYSQKGIVFDLNSLNVLMGGCYSKNFKAIELIQDYIYEKSIRLDSLGYTYLILAILKNQGFEKAYNLFIEASIFGIQQNLTVIVSLLSEIDNAKVVEKNKCINFILHHIQKFYASEVVEYICFFFKFFSCK